MDLWKCNAVFQTDGPFGNWRRSQLRMKGAVVCQRKIHMLLKVPWWMVNGQSNRCPVEEHLMCWKENTQYLLKKPTNLFRFDFLILVVVCISILPDPKPQNSFYPSLFLGSVIKFYEFIFHNVFCIWTFLPIVSATFQIWAITNSYLGSCISLLTDLSAFSFPVFCRYKSNCISLSHLCFYDCSKFLFYSSVL